MRLHTARLPALGLQLRARANAHSTQLHAQRVPAAAAASSDARSGINRACRRRGGVHAVYNRSFDWGTTLTASTRLRGRTPLVMPVRAAGWAAHAHTMVIALLLRLLGPSAAQPDPGPLPAGSILTAPARAMCVMRGRYHRRRGLW